MSDPKQLIQSAKDAIKTPFSFPGGYEKAIYLSDGERICRKCALDNWASIVDDTKRGSNGGYGILGVDVHWEGPVENCCECGSEMASEYGDPDQQ